MSGGTADLEKRVHEIDWWHRIDLGGGIVTPGKDDSAYKLARLHLPDLRGRSVLDIGAWDGYFSFAAERLGASRVVALDYWTWTTGLKEGFDLARDVLGSKVEDVVMRAEDVSPEAIGRFDVVLFLGVLYHLEDPIRVLRRVASVASELLVVETLVDLLGVRRPAAALYPGSSKDGDASNWWGPNVPACEAMLRECGFDDVKVVSEPGGIAKRAVRAARLRDYERLRRDRAVLHGRRR